MPRKTNDTRNANGDPSIKKKTLIRNGKEYTYWFCRVTVGYDNGTGKQIQKDITGKTQKEVVEKKATLIANIQNNTYMPNSHAKMSLNDWLNEWLESYVHTAVKPYTYDSYFRICKNHIIPALGAVKLNKLSSSQIQKTYNYFINEKNLSAKTVKNIHGTLHKALFQAVQLGLINNNPSEICTLPKVIKKEIKPMEEKDIINFLKASNGNKFQLLFEIVIFTGMRKGEALGLTWDSVDFENNYIYINKQLQKDKKVGGKYILAPTKNSQNRLIKVAPSVINLFKIQKMKQEQLEIMADGAWDNSFNLVFTNEFGGHLNHCTVYKYFKKIVTEIGIPEERFHDMRHSYAVISIQNGDDIKTVQSNLGHANAGFTLNTYAHVSEQMRNNSADNMEKFINGLK